MARIFLENLSKRFGRLLAVDGFTLEIPSGQFTAILGPSGCGKTTTMNMISGLEVPTSGKVYISDRDVTRVSASERGIGFVFQNYAIFTHMSVYDNLAFGLRVKKRPAEEVKAKVAETAELLQLGGLLHANAGGLSVNDMQKVALGRSMITQPGVFLLDEPLSNLDAAFRAVMRAELKRLQKELEQTMVYVTHDQVEAMTMADKIAVMDLGRLQQFDSPDVIYNHPKNKFVANFIGSPTMNFLDCTYGLSDGRAVLSHKAFTLDAAPYRERIEKEASGKELILGIRPENVVVRESPASASDIAATVYVTEPLGSKTILFLKIGRDLVKATIPATYGIRPDEKRWVHFVPEKIHLIDKATELTIV